MKRATVAFVFGAGLSLGASATAGPWVKEPLESYVKLSESVFIADEFVDHRVGSGQGASVQTSPDHLAFNTALYLELGLFPRLQLGAYLPFFVGQNAYRGGYEFLSSKMGDALVHVQYGLGIPWFVSSIKAEVKLPLYDVTKPVGPDRTRFPVPGEGQVDATLSVAVGDSIPGIPAYGFVEVGHRFRTEAYLFGDDVFSFGDSLVGSGQLGGWLVEKTLLVAANATFVVPYSDDETTKRYATLGLSAYVPAFSGFAVEAYGDWLTWTKNSSSGFTAGLGFSHAGRWFE